MGFVVFEFEKKKYLEGIYTVHSQGRYEKPQINAQFLSELSSGTQLGNHFQIDAQLGPAILRISIAAW